MSRFLLLHKHWCWQLNDDVSLALFQRLVDISKSCKFIVQESDSRLLMEDVNTDSTFTIFLKLIFASTEQMRPTLCKDEYLGPTKKLLSLVTPVGSVQLSALRSLFDEQLSMLYSRFSSLALAIRILPSAENVLYRVSLARRYVDFGRSVAATCSVCIRAASFLALQALDMSQGVQWPEDLVDMAAIRHTPPPEPQLQGAAPISFQPDEPGTASFHKPFRRFTGRSHDAGTDPSLRFTCLIHLHLFVQTPPHPPVLANVAPAY